LSSTRVGHNMDSKGENRPLRDSSLLNISGKGGPQSGKERVSIDTSQIYGMQDDSLESRRSRRFNGMT
jgi:hypothetical protein